MRRASLLPEERIFDDAEFGAAMAEVLGRLGKEKGAIRVLIAGSTDTGLYTSLLNAAAAAGGEAFARSLSVTLVDQCGTPLKILQALRKGERAAARDRAVGSRRPLSPKRHST